MRVRDWQDILEDVTSSGVDPDGWRAIAGDRATGVGEDMYVGHPDAGLYQFKTYAKNPFEVQGVGARVARRLDDEIGSFFPDHEDASRFAINEAPDDADDAEQTAKQLEEVIKAHAEAPTEPDHLFEDVMDALDSPAFGPLEYDQYDRPEGLEDLSGTFEEAEALLETEFEDVVDEADVGRGFH
jgi:hypothetical protein